MCEENLENKVSEQLKTLNESVASLVERLKEKDEIIEKLKSVADLCWWDGKRCHLCGEISGLQNLHTFCHQCYRLDFEEMKGTFEELFGPLETLVISKDDYREEMDEVLRTTKEEIYEKFSRSISSIQGMIDV